MQQAVLGPVALSQSVLDRQVVPIHIESQATHEAPKMRTALAGLGINANVKTLAASMQRQGLGGIFPRRFRLVTQLLHHSLPTA